jgi:cytochrome c2
MHEPLKAGRIFASIVVFTGLSLSNSAALAQDAIAEAGEAVFKKCQACHSLEAGRHRAGPSLAGVFGAPAAVAEGYVYSPAMEQSGWFGMPKLSIRF